MILDILSTWTTIYLIYSRTITRVFIDPIVLCTSLFFIVILIVLWTLLSFLHTHSIVLSFPIVQDLDPPFVLSWTLTRYCICVEQ
jgi:hypothetical protein